MPGDAWKRHAAASLLPRISERCVRDYEFSAAQKADRVDQAPRRVADIFMKIRLVVEIVTACRVGLVVADVAADAPELILRISTKSSLNCIPKMKNVLSLTSRAIIEKMSNFR
jgi:hypothetical protein